MTLLARRDYATQELRAHLESRGFDPSVVELAVNELVERRVLDDPRFAEHYISSHSERGQGPLRIEQELRQLGLAAAIIDEALRNGPNRRQLAREVRVRKFGAEAPRDWTEKARQARFLQYRGFSSDDIQSATGADLESDP